METKWLWKMTSTEEYYEPFTVSYQLTLVTREPLLQEQLVRTLLHLHRKVPLLRACYGERDGETWLREMQDEIIDFEMVPDAKSNELHHKLHQYEFNRERGPLWCVKLRPEPHSSPDGVFREGVSGYPHMYTLFLGVNHANTDGTSNAMICGFLVQLLDDVLAGKHIDDEEQLGVFIPDEKTKSLIKEQEAVLETDPELKDRLLKDYQALKERRSYINSVFKGVGEKEGRSVILTQNWDAETTAAFIKRCRAEGVTVNSAYTAIASLAMVDLLVDGGFAKDSYSIRSAHVLNARRYWEEDTSKYLGCHLLPFMIAVVKTPRDAGEGIWNYARSVHEELQRKIRSGTPLKEEVVKELVPKHPDFDPWFEFEFCVTNMGDVTKKVTEGGDHVQAVHILRTAAVHGVPSPSIHFMHTFRGCLTNALVYNTSFLTSQMAEKFSERILHHLHASL
nr:uncharacterized protein LOC113808270 [Penaeus vannamei]